MRIVLDTNVLLQCISRKSPHHWIWQAFRQQTLTLCVTTDILDEYHEKVVDFYESAELADNILDAITTWTSLVRVEKYFFWQIPYGDEDDQKFVDCHVACNAAYLVTEDRVLHRELKATTLVHVKAIKPDAFLKIFTESSLKNPK
jgi:uncharacterized protein